ncbi:MAG: hypothetical protein U0W40_17710 [Acidimicrobiia bacterium]
MSITGLDPTSGPLPEAEGRPAQRAPEVHDVVLGLVSNGLGRSDDILAAVAKEIELRAPVVRVVSVRKPSVSVPPDPIDWEKLINEVTVAVAGFGG